MNGEQTGYKYSNHSSDLPFLDILVLLLNLDYKVKAYKAE